MRRGQAGFVAPMVLVLLGLGALLLAPTLRYAGSALTMMQTSRETADVQYALDAITQQALAMLEYTDEFEDCDGDGSADSFADCVAANGSWTLATPAYLQSVTNETEVAKVNGQEVEVSVEVPGELTAPADPTPTPIAGACFYARVTRDPTWVQVGEPVTYTLHIWNCSTSSSQKDLRHVGVLAEPGMSYVVDSTGGSLVSPPMEPETTDCQAPSPNVSELVCPGADPTSLVLAYPTNGTPWQGSDAVKMVGGEERVLTFQLAPQEWGIFYIDVTLCYFNAGDPCKVGSRHNTGRVAPVVAGVFNVQGKGKGHAFGASSKLDDGGSALVSEDPG